MQSLIVLWGEAFGKVFLRGWIKLVNSWRHVQKYLGFVNPTLNRYPEDAITHHPDLASETITFRNLLR